MRIHEEMIKGTGETILIIDDDENVRALLKLMLEPLKYKTLSAIDGKSGIEIYKKKKNEIKLILLDVVMPEMDGLITFQQLKKIYSDVHVLVISGFCKEGKASEIIKEGAVGFIKKPFKLNELLKIIHNSLND